MSIVFVFAVGHPRDGHTKLTGILGSNLDLGSARKLCHSDTPKISRWAPIVADRVKLAKDSVQSRKLLVTVDRMIILGEK